MNLEVIQRMGEKSKIKSYGKINVMERYDWKRETDSKRIDMPCHKFDDK